jgi:hypothetical protein
MHPPTSRRARFAAVAALIFCLAPARAEAATFTVPVAGDESSELVLDGGRVVPLGASLLDLAAFAGDSMVWFDESPRAPVAEPFAPRPRVVVESADQIRHHEGGVTALRATVSDGATVVDAWFLLAVPFLLPVILLRRTRAAAKAWADQIAELDEQANE